MSNFQPAPTYAELLLVDPKSGRAAFNPIWLNWFISLTQNVAAGGPVSSVTASGPLASSGGANPNITLGVIGAANFPALTGDITTAGGTLATVLKNTGTAGTYTKITFDAQGRETSGATAAASDLSNGTTGGGAIVLANTPTLITPVLGVASATSLTFGGTVLSHYDEGAWTPIDSSGASLVFANAAGFYTRVGRMVAVTARFDYPITASGSTALVGGLPFTCNNASAAQSGEISATNNATIRDALINQNTTNFNLYALGALSGSTNAQASNSIYFFSAVYFI